MCQPSSRIQPYSTSPIILLTPSLDPEDIIRGLKRQGDNYLTKPYETTRYWRIEYLLANQHSGRMLGSARSRIFFREKSMSSIRTTADSWMLISEFEDGSTNRELMQRTSIQASEGKRRPCGAYGFGGFYRAMTTATSGSESCLCEDAG